MFDKLFQKKKQVVLNSDEYVELRALYDKLRVRVEGLIIEIDLYKSKLRKGKGLKQEEEEEKSDDKGYNPMFIPEKEK